MKLKTLKSIINRYGEACDDYEVFVDVFTGIPGESIKLGILGCVATSNREKTFHLTGDVEPTNKNTMSNINSNIINKLNGIR